MSDKNTVKENTEDEKMGEHDKIVVSPPADIPEKKAWVSFEDSDKKSMVFLWSTIVFILLFMAMIILVAKNSYTGSNTNVKTLTLDFEGKQKTEINNKYEAKILFQNTKGPFELNIISGKLPPGLAFSQNSGEIYGIPTTEGIYEFTIKISDSTKNHAEKKIKLEIIPEPLKIVTSKITSSDDRMFYKKLEVIGGNPNYSYELLSGHFPPVLGISPTGEIIGHIPKGTKGTWDFKIKVTDSKNNSISEVVKFTVIPNKENSKKSYLITKKAVKFQKPISDEFNVVKLRQMEKNLGKFYPILEKNGIKTHKVKISKFTTKKVKIQYYQSLKKLSDIQKGYNMSDNNELSTKELVKKIQKHQTETQNLYNYFLHMEKI